MAGSSVCNINEIFTAHYQAPYAVLIMKIAFGNVFMNVREELVCGGSIYTSLFVITAAKCISDKLLQVKAGMNYLTDNSAYVQARYVVRIFTTVVQPPYDTTPGIALMKVEREFDFNSMVQPVVLSQLYPDGSLRDYEMAIWIWDVKFGQNNNPMHIIRKKMAYGVYILPRDSAQSPENPCILKGVSSRIFYTFDKVDSGAGVVRTVKFDQEDGNAEYLYFLEAIVIENDRGTKQNGYFSLLVTSKYGKWIYKVIKNNTILSENLGIICVP